MKFVIEHLDPELFEWCLIEYKHISSFVGKENLIITNVQAKDVTKLSGFSEVKTESAEKLGLRNTCVLDPSAEKTLSPSDKFDYLIFGGILGDNPPRERTKEELKMPGAERRNLGKEQMPTDNAVYCANLISDGKKFEEIDFIDGIEIDISEGESVMFPFRYVAIKGKPLFSEELKKHLKESGEF